MDCQQNVSRKGPQQLTKACLDQAELRRPRLSNSIEPPRVDRDPRQRRTFHSEYILSSKLGKGAFAQVYVVRKNGSAEPEPLAVKVMDLRLDRSAKPQSDQESTDPKRRHAVDSEIGILARVAGLKYTISMVDSYVDGCFSYIVMERCDRTLLTALEAQPALNEYTLKKFFRDMLEGLKAVHQLGVVHRDVKPDNFLCVGQENVVKLCDFGLASCLSYPGDLLSGVYGTPPFMSPEMLCSQGYGENTDVWSVGVIVYVLLLGQFPYKPAEPSGKAMKAAIKAGVPEPTFRAKPRLETGGDPGVTEEGRQFLMNVLVRDPSIRPSARHALNIPWLTDLGTKEARDASASLRPMLYAARRAGAFDPPRNDKDVDKTGMDALMADLQSRHQQGKSILSKGSKGGMSCASTDISSMSASDRSGHSSIDFQAPGVVGCSSPTSP